MMDLGKWIPVGLADGMENNLGSVDKIADRMANASVPDIPSRGSFGQEAQRDAQPTTHDNRVYITVEGNIDRDLYEDITRRMAREANTKLRVAGVKR
jgi:hypothetical protein